MHSRTIIRNTIIDALGSLTTVDSVYNMVHGAFPVEKSVNVLTLDEIISDDGYMNDLSDQNRELRIQLEIRSPVENEASDELDTISDEIEDKMLNDVELMALAYDINLDSINFEYDRNGKSLLGKSIMIFSMVYQTSGLDPSMIL